ncbi:MAG: CNNM domain-containing protein, partial [Planctomycetota bacterium]
MTLLLVYMFVAIGCSFYCSVAEAVLLSISPSFIATMRKSRPAAAEKLQSLKSNIDRPLAAILSLNTIAHTIGAAGVGAQVVDLYGNRYLGVASAVMTLLILIFSEIIPKTVGALYWRSLGPIVATTVRWLIVALYPLVWLSEQLTKMISGGKSHHTLSREELTAMAQIGASQGVLEKSELRVFDSLMRLPGLCTRDIMTPRVVVVAFDESKTVGEIASREPAVKMSRLPVMGSEYDLPVGFVLKDDLLLAEARDQSDEPIKTFKRPLTTVREDLPLPQLLETLLEGRIHIAAVGDQYGSFVGIVTLEDLLETLLGLEIIDEHDAQADMQQFARERWEQRAQKMGLQTPNG